ncbi:hypothetical protein LR48_Vigan208s000500 [Vigna angularis]|uniref:Putative plant transposon protein domain-containing protein n=1 Tax=Phaseolus angularis TaxID=3914 RepID=A0A0L9T5W3_PHAAN|nr:hypothetical protein LR48_Vigan208s000500 [Vigna angularis]
MTSSSGKRMKTMASKRKEKESEQPHSSRFLSRKHEKHFKVVQDRRLLMERKVGMIPNFAPQLLGNDWGKLATYPTPANIAVVKEFYTNARKIGDYPAENYLGYVRGHAIRHDPESINNFLDTVWAYYRQYCGGEDVAQPVPPRRARRERGPAQSQTSANTHEAEPFQMRDMYMSLIGAQLQSIHRGWTMDEFHNVVAWPEEPVHGGGAGAAEASARDMEEDEAEEEDAFDDDEDEEEEEDTEDSSD